jgi:hypothetical protein
MKKYLLALALVLSPLPAFAQAVPLKFDSAANTNPTLVRAGNSLLKSLIVINTTTTLFFLKFFDTATLPTQTTCGTNTVVLKIPVPFGATNAGGGVAMAISPDGLQFYNGIAFCLVGGIADSDTSNAATGVVINLGVKQ